MSRRKAAAAAPSLSDPPGSSADEAFAPAAPQMPLWASAAYYAAWGLLCLVFAAAYIQGAAFASSKESASVWGVVIGLAAFCAWLAVAAEEDAEEDEEDEEEDEWDDGDEAGEEEGEEEGEEAGEGEQTAGGGGDGAASEKARRRARGAATGSGGRAANKPARPKQE